MPCSVFDYGLGLRWDEEGDGLLQTYDFAGRFAGTFALETGDALHNIKIGGNFQLTFRQVDFDRFVFSDELDPKYGSVDAFGNDLPTAFVPPDGDRSNLFFAPGIGVAYRFLSDQRSRKPWSLLAGLAYHNAYSFGVQRNGHEESLLHIGTRIPERLNLFLSGEWIAFNNANSYVAVTPLLLYQKQGTIDYLEGGAKVALNRLLSAGVYYHFNGQPIEGSHTNWFSFVLEFGSVLGARSSKRLDLGLAYSNNFSGLRNTVGPILEFSLSFHFASSGACKLMGREDLVPYSSDVQCPTTAFSPGRRKMYENIWYKTSNR